MMALEIKIVENKENITEDILIGVPSTLNNVIESRDVDLSDVKMAILEESDAILKEHVSTSLFFLFCLFSYYRFRWTEYSDIGTKYSDHCPPSFPQPFYIRDPNMGCGRPSYHYVLDSNGMNVATEPIGYPDSHHITLSYVYLDDRTHYGRHWHEFAALESNEEVKDEAQEAVLSAIKNIAEDAPEDSKLDSNTGTESNSKIKQTKAEEEAIARGLQTIRNDDDRSWYLWIRLSWKVEGVGCTENYKVWFAAVQLALHTRNKSGFISGKCVRDKNEGPLQEQWDRQFDSLVDLPAYTCEGSTKLKEHARLLMLMQFLMGLDDVFNFVRSIILTIELIPDVKFAFATLFRDDSHRNSQSSSKSMKDWPSAFAGRPNSSNSIAIGLMIGIITLIIMEMVIEGLAV
ncbi:hypothetical protein Tco_0300470 [Tanacetum coccineum]